MSKKGKVELVKKILDISNIHHNIRISSGRMVDYTEEDCKNGFDWTIIAGYLVDAFKSDFENIELTLHNDTGNRNLGEGCELKGEVWQHGRQGATLYWDRYWTGGHYYGFKYSADELVQMEPYELEVMYADISFFNKSVGGLMDDFYGECQRRLKYVRLEARDKERLEKLYQKTKQVIVANDMFKRLVSDMLS